MIRIFAAGIFAVLLFGAALVVSGATTTEALSTPVSVKGDRLDAKPFGAACSQASWPHYEPKCLRNTVTPTRDVVPVRIVSTNRLK
jgi:hypothetical protein